MDAIPHKMGKGTWSHFTLEMIGVSFGGTWTTLDDDIITPCTWALAFGGIGRHLLSLVFMWRIGF
jgi:hypothetical protein